MKSGLSLRRLLRSILTHAPSHFYLQFVVFPPEDSPLMAHILNTGIFLSFRLLFFWAMA